jgi:TPR repeat protein
LTGGKGVPMDLESAAKYFKIAAEAGSAQVKRIILFLVSYTCKFQAHGYLGRMYLEGTSASPQNNMTAFQYFKKAADKV